MVTIEAMIAGIPVIGSNAGGTPEILTHGEYGLLYRPGDHQDFVRNAIRYLQHPLKAAQLGDKAREYASHKFSHHTECAQIESLIHQIIPNS
jgi:glycosyltransferase involved in cell wall biosynthesis